MLKSKNKCLATTRNCLSVCRARILEVRVMRKIKFMAHICNLKTVSRLHKMEGAMYCQEN